MNKTLRYFSLWYLQAVGVIAAACAGFAVGALLEIRSSGAGLLSTYLSSVPIMVLLLSLIMPYTSGPPGGKFFAGWRRPRCCMRW